MAAETSSSDAASDLVVSPSEPGSASGESDADGARFSHLDATGRARMVDVSDKPVTRRIAEASCRVQMRRATVDQLDRLPKGDAFAVARLAGIQAAKRTAEWVPLAHPLPLDEVAVELEPDDRGVLIASRVVCRGRHRGGDGSLDCVRRGSAGALRHGQSGRA